jgi:hypothetical protein
MKAKATPAETKWKTIFHSLWRSVSADQLLLKAPLRPEVVFSGGLSEEVCAEIEFTDSVSIYISSKFIASLQSELRSHGRTLAKLAFEPGSSAPCNADLPVQAVEEFAIAFVLLHEIFHLMGGHIEWMSSQNFLSFDERRLGLSPRRPHESGKAPSYQKLGKAYLLESEADCNALHWIVQSVPGPALKQLLGGNPSAITLYDGARRIMGFRVLLIAVWLVLRRMEASRAAWLGRQSRAHPLPAARLFSAIGTLILEYSWISDLRYNAQGARLHMLSQEDVESMRTFMLRILSPVLRADWTPGKKLVKMDSLEGSMLKVFPDFANHMFNRSPQTEVGREIARMERVRLRMNLELAEFRYFSIPLIIPTRGRSSKP